jgi:hypothetical protein
MSEWKVINKKVTYLKAVHQILVVVTHLNAILEGCFTAGNDRLSHAHTCTINIFINNRSCLNNATPCSTQNKRTAPSTVCVFLYTYTRTKFKLTKPQSNTTDHKVVRLPYPKPICAASNLKACLILTTLNSSALLSHLVGEECTRDKVNSKWRPKEWAPKDGSTSLDALTTE